MREFKGFLRKVEGIAEMTNKTQVKEGWPPYLTLLITIPHKLAEFRLRLLLPILAPIVQSMLKVQHGLAYTMETAYLIRGRFDLFQV